MPVRIYDIAKKLGVESKKVLAKAKELGITQARVPSSSIDKITAEYLEMEMGGQPSISVVEPEAVKKSEPVIIVSEPEKEPEAEPKPPAETAATAETAEPPTGEAPPEPAGAVAESEAAEPPELGQAAAAAEAVEGDVKSESGTESETAPPSAEIEEKEKPPAEPEEAKTEQTEEVEETADTEEAESERYRPKLGEKVGFIQLPSRPVSRAGGKGRKAEKARGKGAKAAETEARSRRVEERKAESSRPPASKPQAPQRPAIQLPKDAEVITLKQPIIVRDLAEKLGKKPFQIIADLMEIGVFATLNQTIDEENARHVCAKHNFRFELEKRERGAGLVKAVPKKVVLDVDDKPEDLKLRAPVVTIMGHVDHGKTTLLDYIRKTNVAGGEEGGITQHIGAYTISVPHPEKKSEMHQITFLDTPGHAAFSAMRARGANVTDIVILVVAANDGLMPQTNEAINHAKAAEVPIIVAVNKCDHAAANPLRVRQQLQEQGLMCEEWGGETIFVDVSALKGEGVNKLLEMVLLQAEIMELKANPNRKAVGNVIESGMEPGGPVATVLVRKGTLKVGDVLICGHFYGKARALISEEGKRLKSAEPSMAVRILGLNGVPEAGLEFNVVSSDKEARQLADERAESAKASSQEKRGGRASLENLFSSLHPDAAKQLKAVVKADTQGSVEAIVDALNKIDSKKVELEVIHSAVGSITESDVLLASASNAIIMGFHTRIDGSARALAKREGVQIKQYTIIYELIDEVKEAMAGLLDPELKEVVLGGAEVRRVFHLSKGGAVAGCMVTNGRLVKGKIRVVRNGEVIHTGVAQTLRRFQDEVNEVRAGMECGIRVSNFGEFREGDVLESFTVEKVMQKL